MRDLRAELKSRPDDDPVEWTPKEGDIIVGFVRSTPSAHADTGSASAFLVCEERAMTPVRVNLDSPQLTALLELHNPHENERVGIKYVGVDGSGVKRYQMIVDRAAYSGTEPAQVAPPEVSPSEPPAAGVDHEDDSAAATPEEKDYIKRMLSAGAKVDHDPAESVGQDHLRGLIRRQEEELDRQTRTLQRLEAMICSAVPEPEASEEETRGASASDPTPTPAPASTPTPREPRRVINPRAPRRKWLRALIPWLAAAAALSAGAAYLFFAHSSLPWP